MTLATLVTGRTAAEREAAIAANIRTPSETAVILEGLPVGRIEDTVGPLQMPVHHIAPACPCCTGSLTFRVTLDRVLRRKPARLFLGIASAAHLETIRDMLTAPPYAALLQLSPDLPA